MMRQPTWRLASVRPGGHRRATQYLEAAFVFLNECRIESFCAFHHPIGLKALQDGIHAGHLFRISSLVKVAKWFFQETEVLVRNLFVLVGLARAL
jgi:hypothetical protein